MDPGEQVEGAKTPRKNARQERQSYALKSLNGSSVIYALARAA